VLENTEKSDGSPRCFLLFDMWHTIMVPPSGESIAGFRSLKI